MGLNPPFVSVIIPIYNGEDDMQGVCDRLMAQTYPPSKVEYLLVDNKSCDRTPEILQAAVVAAEQQGITFRYLQETQIQSSYAARNQGIRAAKGEILAFTDADCYPQPTWLADLVVGFEDPAVGLVVGEVSALPGHTWLESYAERRQMMTQKDTLAHPFCPYGQTANIAVRARVFEQVGLFRPYLTTGGDADMCWRIQREGGWQLHFAEQAIVQHRHRRTLKDLRSQWYRYGKSNRYLHDLHGVELTRSLGRNEVRYQLSRWTFKELPLTLWKMMTGKAIPIDLAMTPINLYCAAARDAGQREAQLPEAARAIEWLEQSLSPY